MQKEKQRPVEKVMKGSEADEKYQTQPKIKKVRFVEQEKSTESEKTAGFIYKRRSVVEWDEEFRSKAAKRQTEDDLNSEEAASRAAESEISARKEADLMKESEMEAIDQQKNVDDTIENESDKGVSERKLAAKKVDADKKEKKKSKVKDQVPPGGKPLEWRKVRGTRRAEEAQSSSSSDAPESSKEQPADRSQRVRRNRNKKWVSKPVCETSREMSEGNSSDDDKEYIYTQVCCRINELTLELDKLQEALPARESFIKKYERKRQAEVMSVGAAPLKDDQVPEISFGGCGGWWRRSQYYV